MSFPNIGKGSLRCRDMPCVHRGHRDLESQEGMVCLDGSPRVPDLGSGCLQRSHPLREGSAAGSWSRAATSRWTCSGTRQCLLADPELLSCPACKHPRNLPAGRNHRLMHPGKILGKDPVSGLRISYVASQTMRIRASTTSTRKGMEMHVRTVDSARRRSFMDASRCQAHGHR